MNKFKIYHNPRCSKSRETLELLEEGKVDLEITKYLETPITEVELKKILELLKVKPIDICRTGETLFKDRGLSKTDSDETIFQAILKNPILLERPIVIKDNSKAIIGRPPKKVLDLI